MNKLKFKKTDDWANLILRRIDPDSVETDTILGGFYSYISLEKSSGTFKEITKMWSEDDLKNVYAVITFFDQSIVPLYVGSEYYVMTDTGGTIANRSKK
ncbi:MAG TPA: hypothetical protein VFG54_12270 [Prolixibacteraceae bacterium]|nr:hypothetical protein [Prolixibacteraceae bacterium]